MRERENEPLKEESTRIYHELYSNVKSSCDIIEYKDKLEYYIKYNVTR